MLKTKTFVVFLVWEVAGVIVPSMGSDFERRREDRVGVVFVLISFALTAGLLQVSISYCSFYAA